METVTVSKAFIDTAVIVGTLLLFACYWLGYYQASRKALRAIEEATREILEGR